MDCEDLDIYGEDEIVLGMAAYTPVIVYRDTLTSLEHEASLKTRNEACEFRQCNVGHFQPAI